MKTCLSAAGASADSKPLNSQQQKMKDCNATAKTKALTGDDRKAFMSTCLKGGPASQ
jgi:psiF repeat-containing protein